MKLFRLLALLVPLAAPLRADVLYTLAGNFATFGTTLTKISAAGATSTFANFGVGTTEGPAKGLAFDRAGNLYVAVEFANRIDRFTPAGTRSVFASTLLNAPQGLAFDAAGNLYVANGSSASDNTIVRFTPAGAGSVFATGVRSAKGIAFDAAGNLLAVTAGTIAKFTPAGARSTFADNSAAQPEQLAFDAAGNLHATIPATSTILKFTADGASSVFASAVTLPLGLAFDSAGNLHVSLLGGSILKFTPAGARSTFATGLTSTNYLAFTTDAGVPLPVPPGGATPPPPPAADPGRIINMSIRSGAGTGAQTLIVGAIIGGAGASGTKPLLIRGTGPALTGFGVPGALADPTLSVFAGNTVVASNDNWGGDAQVTLIGGALGAFPLTMSASRDAALYAPALAARDYTVQITGVGGTTGIALAEIYDATPAGTFTATTPQLTNVSARTQVGTGADILIAGFVIGGSTSRTVLIRGVGPTLTPFGVPGVLADPQLALFTGAGVRLQENNDWGAAANAAQITATTTALATFQLAAGSRDAAILTTLAPGSYTAQVSGVGGTTGVALVEIYVVP